MNGSQWSSCYKCTGCGSPWNRPILQRRPVRTIEPDFLMALNTSEAMLTRRLAFDVEELRRKATRPARWEQRSDTITRSGATSLDSLVDPPDLPATSRCAFSALDS